MFKILQLIPILLALNHDTEAFGADKNSWNQEAFLWPGPKGKGIHVKFSDSPADWSDLYSLVASKGFYTLGKLCVRGTFILYESPLFEVKTPNAFHIMSGIGKCSVISDSTKSIQLVGSMGRIKSSSITFFEKPYFGSVAHPTIFNVGSRFFRKMEHTLSMITSGIIPWTIQLKNGTRFCLKPQFDPTERNPICLVRDLRLLIDNSETPETIENPQIVRATQGCRKEITEELVFRIQDCLYLDKKNHTGKRPGNIIARSDDVEGRTLSADGLCGGNEERAKNVFALYKAAITRNFEFPMFIGWHKLGKNAWKFDILDYIFSIVEDHVPEDLIPFSYMNKMREFFVSKWATAWEKTADTHQDTFSLSDKEYSTLIRLLKYCKRRPSWTSEFRRSWALIQTMDQFNNVTSEGFRYNPSRNIIVEFVWLAGHMVGSLCHLDYAYKLPFWALYFRAFLELYMLPIVPEWKIPQEATELIFGGIDHVLEYKKFAMFTSKVQKAISLIEPLDRPAGLFEKMVTASN
ncbi:hypothetical protein Ocin01_10302 [Orchesella cincta]|uniref:Uncharacterized protein n=1 Tax=Orchesella cincta TaxID=48709 RepID=A0A1D2MTH1_ORCCI|nr:hypothetical protein Ocin01_10302 [Orchesella cincta]